MLGSPSVSNFIFPSYTWHNNGQYYDLTLGEILFLRGTTTNTIREKIEGYLAHKWGVSLPMYPIHGLMALPTSTNQQVPTFPSIGESVMEEPQNLHGLMK